jgi:hypothetical protein
MTRCHAPVVAQAPFESVTNGLFDSIFQKSRFSASDTHLDQYPCGFYELFKNGVFARSKKTFFVMTWTPRFSAIEGGKNRENEKTGIPRKRVSEAVVKMLDGLDFTGAIAGQASSDAVGSAKSGGRDRPRKW